MRGSERWLATTRKTSTSIRESLASTARLWAKRGFLGLVAIAGTACADLTHVDPKAGEEALARVLAIGQAGPPADVAIVLGCPAGDDGLPSPCQLCRIDAAALAYARHEVRAVILSGSAVWSPYVEAEVLASALRERGVPDEALVREPKALTTWMNLRFSQRLMAQHGFHRALIISTADHLPRAERFAAYYGIDARYRACDRPAPAAPQPAPPSLPATEAVAPRADGG